MATGKKGGASKGSSKKKSSENSKSEAEVKPEVKVEPEVDPVDHEANKEVNPQDYNKEGNYEPFLQPVASVEGKSDVEVDHSFPGEKGQEVSDDITAPEFVDVAEDVEGNSDAPEDYILLTDKQKGEIIKEAAKIARKDAIQRAKEDFMEDALAKAKTKEDAKHGIISKERMVNHTVNLAQSAAFHLINFKQYFHGHTYEVLESVAKGMRDTEFRGHVQEDIRKGNNRNEYGLQNRDGVVSGPVSAGGGVVRA